MWNILNSADYGLPQNRLRVFIIDTRNDFANVSADGGLQYHIGGISGPISHPEWYAKKYKIKPERWEKVHQQPRGKAV